MKRRNLIAAAIVVGAACLMIVDVSTPSARLCATEISQGGEGCCHGGCCDVVQVEHEHPYETVIDTARKRGCDAIVMASHGRRGVSAIVLGSETVKVLTHSTIPVVVVRA